MTKLMMRVLHGAVCAGAVLVTAAGASAAWGPYGSWATFGATGTCSGPVQIHAGSTLPSGATGESHLITWYGQRKLQARTTGTSKPQYTYVQARSWPSWITVTATSTGDYNEMGTAEIDVPANESHHQCRTEGYYWAG